MADEDLLALYEVKRERASALPWESGDLYRLARRVASRCVGSLSIERLSALLDHAPQLTLRLLGPLLVQSFSDRVVTFPNELSEQERALLLRAAGVWDSLADHERQTLAKSGLPLCETSLRRFLCLRPLSTLDRVVTVSGESMQMWRALRRAVYQLKEAPAVVDAIQDLLRTTLDADGLLEDVVERDCYVRELCPHLGRTQLSAETPIQRPFPRLATVLAECVAPVSTVVMPRALASLDKLLEQDRPDLFAVMVYLLIVSRDAVLPERFDPLVRQLVVTLPTNASPVVVATVLKDVATERVRRLVGDLSLYYKGDPLQASYPVTAEAGWWYVGLRQTEQGFAAIADAIRAWSALGPSEERARAAAADDRIWYQPFPIHRAIDALSSWDADEVSRFLEKMIEDPLYDAQIVATLRAATTSRG